MLLILRLLLLAPYMAYLLVLGVLLTIVMGMAWALTGYQARINLTYRDLS